MPTITGSGTTAITLTPHHRLVTLTGTLNATGPAGTYNTGNTQADFTAAIFGPEGKPFTFVNDGAITSPGAAAQDAGIVLAAGTIINNNLIAAATGIFIEGPASITNRGAINASIGDGIQLWSTAAITNTGTITAASDGIFLATPGAILNAGLITAGADGIYLGSHINAPLGTITNQAGATIAAGADGVFMRGPDNLTNSGLITGATGVAAGRIGAGPVGAGGQIINDAVIQGATYGVFAAYTSVINHRHATISGGATGLFLGAGYSLRNHGLVTGALYAVFDGGAEPIDNAGAIISPNGSAIFDRSGGRVVNSGLIAGSLGINMRLDPGYLVETGTIINRGIILAAAAAIYAGANSTIVNSGIIEAATAIYAGANSTITDSGAIIGSAGAAIIFAPGADNRLILTQGATITGAISLNGGTIELAAGAEPGRLALTATSLAALIIDPHADWTLAAPSIIAAPLTNNGTLTDGPGGTITFAQPIVGDGTIVLGGPTPSTAVPSGATLTLAAGVAASQTILFTGTGDLLALTDPAAFNARIAGFTTADAILLPSLSGANFISDAFADEVLAITATTGTYHLTFATPTQFHQDTLAVLPEGPGMDILLIPPPQPAASTPQNLFWLSTDLLKPLTFLPVLTTL
jgi:hypothetical protein